MSDFATKLAEKRLTDADKAQIKNRHTEVISSLKGILSKDAPTELNVKNLPQDLARKTDIDRLVDAVSEATLTSFVIFMHSSEQMERLLAQLGSMTKGGSDA